MALFAFFALVLGWVAPFPLARALLERRQQVREQPAASAIGKQSLPSTHKGIGLGYGASRFACASVFVCISCLAWARLEPWPAVVLVCLGAGCLLVACICDCRARIIPWELCAVLIALGTVFAVFVYGLSGLLASIVLSVVAVCGLGALRQVAFRLDRPCPVGAGDMRTIPGLVVFCGVSGSFAGAFACALVMGLWGVGALVLGCIRRFRALDAPCVQALPMAPGFLVWFCVGLFL